MTSTSGSPSERPTAMGTNDASVCSTITLTTDFGPAGAYVAAMKGAILTINPRVTLVDVSHDVGPQRLREAVFLTQTAWPFFPPGAVHIAVVDPGVGGPRRALALETPHGMFLGPDNGVLSAALPDEMRPSGGDGPSAVELRPGYRAVAITEPRYLLAPVSATFHGRDVFAPAAAHLSVGVDLEALGEGVESILAYPPVRAVRLADGSLDGRVVHIDNFGNVLTDIRAEDLPEGEFALDVAGQVASGPVRTYAEASGLAALVGSSGFLEIALPNGDAAKSLGVKVDDAVQLRKR